MERWPEPVPAPPPMRVYSQPGCVNCVVCAVAHTMGPTVQEPGGSEGDEEREGVGSARNGEKCEAHEPEQTRGGRAR